MIPPPRSTLFPYTTLFRSDVMGACRALARRYALPSGRGTTAQAPAFWRNEANARYLNRFNLSPDRKSTRLNSSHLVISYAVFCLKNKKIIKDIKINKIENN